MTHGGYMLALIVGGLALISNWENFSQTPGSQTVFAFLLGSVVIVSFHTIGRATYWSALSTQVLRASPILPPPKPDGSYNPTIAFSLYTDADTRVQSYKSLDMKLTRLFNKTRFDILAAMFAILEYLCFDFLLLVSRVQ